MADYILSCCSTADLTESQLGERDIHYIPFHFSLAGTMYPDDLGRTMPYADFYAAMAQGAETKTSQVNVDEFIGYFTPFLEAGQDILHVSLSSGLSGAMSSAAAARDILAERYPQRQLLLVDSLGASSGYGLLMDELSALRAGGMGIHALHRWAELHRLEVHHWFFSTTLEYYVKGGRISRASGFVGGLLGICPLLDMDTAGRLTPRHKLRGKARVIEEIVGKMALHAENGLRYSGKCFISQSACMEDARAVADLVEARFPLLDGPVVINNIGTTIGSHTGPGTVALFFWGEPRS